jgi:hypothetical protein
MTVGPRAARFFLVQHTKIVRNAHEIFQTVVKHMELSFLYQIAIKYTKTFLSKDFQNRQKSGNFGLKIWHLAYSVWTDKRDDQPSLGENVKENKTLA